MEPRISIGGFGGPAAHRVEFEGNGPGNQAAATTPAARQARAAAAAETAAVAAEAAVANARFMRHPPKRLKAWRSSKGSCRSHRDRISVLGGPAATWIQPVPGPQARGPTSPDLLPSRTCQPGLNPGFLLRLCRPHVVCLGSG